MTNLQLIKSSIWCACRLSVFIPHERGVHLFTDFFFKSELAVACLVIQRCIWDVPRPNIERESRLSLLSFVSVVPGLISRHTSQEFLDVSFNLSHTVMLTSEATNMWNLKIIIIYVKDRISFNIVMRCTAIIVWSDYSPSLSFSKSFLLLRFTGYPSYFYLRSWNRNFVVPVRAIKRYRGRVCTWVESFWIWRRR